MLATFVLALLFTRMFLIIYDFFFICSLLPLLNFSNPFNAIFQVGFFIANDAEEVRRANTFCKVTLSSVALSIYE